MAKEMTVAYISADDAGWARVVVAVPPNESFGVLRAWMAERTEWCRSDEVLGNFDYGYKGRDYFAFYFTDRHAAVAFKLRWC